MYDICSIMVIYYLGNISAATEIAAVTWEWGMCNL